MTHTLYLIPLHTINSPRILFDKQILSRRRNIIKTGIVKEFAYLIYQYTIKIFFSYLDMFQPVYSVLIVSHIGFLSGEVYSMSVCWLVLLAILGGNQPTVRYFTTHKTKWMKMSTLDTA